MLVRVSKYSYFCISHINCYYTSQYMKFFKFDFFEDFDLAKLILTQNSNLKHLYSTFMLVGVSKYSYFFISHINCHYTSKYMKFFKLDFFKDFDLAKLNVTQNSNSKHLESIFMIVRMSKYSYFSISHINCYNTYQYMKFFKFDFFEDFDLAKLILTQNSNSKHL